MIARTIQQFNHSTIKHYLVLSCKFHYKANALYAYYRCVAHAVGYVEGVGAFIGEDNLPLEIIAVVDILTCCFSTPFAIVECQRAFEGVYCHTARRKCGTQEKKRVVVGIGAGYAEVDKKVIDTERVVDVEGVGEIVAKVPSPLIDTMALGINHIGVACRKEEKH